MRTLADAQAYATQKNADAEAYQIKELAEAEAEKITLLSTAESEAADAMLAVLSGNQDFAPQFIQLLIAQELQENSKWIIGGLDDLNPTIEVPISP